MSVRLHGVRTRGGRVRWMGRGGPRCPRACAWLLNTGWIAGGATQSGRIKIKWTRALLNAALEGRLDDADFQTDPLFGFAIPQACPEVPSEILNPEAFSNAAPSCLLKFCTHPPSKMVYPAAFLILY